MMTTYKPERWVLDDLLPEAGSDAMEGVIEETQARLGRFSEFRKVLTTDVDPETFAAILDLYEQLYADASALAAYSYLWFSEETVNQKAVTFRARVSQLVADIENGVLFFTLWWKQLDDATARRLLEVRADVRYHMETLRRFKTYTLTEDQERVINIKNVNGIESELTIYDMITTGFRFTLTVDGKDRELTRGQLMAFASDPSPDLRAEAYQDLLHVYGNHLDVLAQIYAARVRDWSEEQVELRGFDSPISVRNLSNNIPDPVIDTMLSVVREQSELFRRFFRFKAEKLGVDRLRRYDLYAPLTKSERTYTFDEAIALVDASYREFSPTLADHARRVIEDRHLDAQIRDHKMDGAYCYGALPSLTPWVLINFTGKIRDVSTLAHELGHAVHAMVAGEHSVLTFHASMPMAETASVFGEMLLMDKLLRAESDPLLRQTLLSTFLDEAYATIVRQAYFVLFEREAHQVIRDGGVPDDVNAIYLENLREQFGNAMVLSDDFMVEWTAIPHIYQTPFYCYAYAFGNLLVLALYRKYQEIGDPFVPGYLKILSYGGSASPDDIIREAGFDIRSPDFWASGFQLLQEMLDELEQIP
jgi:oligoendopeptidase F